MGITIIEKNTASIKEGKKAIVFAGGAVSGGAFMAGGLKALDDCFSGFSVIDFDIFVGISAGSMIATPVSAGIKPDAIIRSLDGRSGRFKSLLAYHYYKPHFGEIFNRSLSGVFSLLSWLPKQMFSSAGSFFAMILDFINSPNEQRYKRIMDYVESFFGNEPIPSIARMMPSGIFDNRPIEEYFRENIHRNRLTNNFKRVNIIRKKKLYILSSRLNDAKRVIFGPDENSSLTISEAIQASTALPVFYVPAKINGIDYIDGGVQDTADLLLASKKGANLIVCYNPFRPYEEDEFFDKVKDKGLASGGLLAVVNQVFRAFFRSRLQSAMEGLKNNNKFKGDVILIEPRPNDAEFFALNPIAFSHRLKASMLGYKSVIQSVADKYDSLSSIFKKHSINFDLKKVNLAVKRSKNKNEDFWRIILEGKRVKKNREICL